MWGNPTDYSLKQFQVENDASIPSKVTTLLGTIAYRHRLDSILSPTVSEFNSVFADTSTKFPWKLQLPGTDCRLHRGLYVDGFEIPPGSAGIIAPADCAVIVMSARQRVLMLHAGRDSLFDRHLIRAGAASKKHESIVFAAWENLSQEERKHVKCLVLPSISAGSHFEHRFDDDRWGQENENLVRYTISRYGRKCIRGEKELGHMDIPRIIATQLTEYCGVDENEIQVVDRCTYTETDQNRYVWHSHARAVRDKVDATTRNLVVVENTSLR